MQISLPYIYGQIEFLEKTLSILKKDVMVLNKKKKVSKKIYGSIPKTNLSFVDFKKLRKALSSSWEDEWK